jgi:hypothetical protein
MESEYQLDGYIFIIPISDDGDIITSQAIDY